MPEAVLKISGAGAAVSAAALAPEVHRDLSRTHAEMKEENGEAVLSIEASDTSAVRAALNSFLECVAVTDSIAKLTEESK
ncbi:hypothetical protein AUQ37_06930 [Candidatus Methanomethylophilus sp. 1R26]|uniref:KEOPS complex subunit Pcc1 n=1 Tax=Candidatus Methanomethylophilus sp. 1R26 TaxID=1769296 RepID=UPI0007366729|nr:KEOPS complex subunit Pcc1 [Candidatus Methanomethylophilus sp. 1R26]KUE74013.1 hypothetical protein AUQ37_06930 [Candidatus Methanomethylophilus sp. 1R26]TQS78603.1 MAG: hypothetical protein A3Q59_07080 [Methanomethylophilus alvi]